MKVGFISLGCPKNLVDSEVMMGQLKQNGYQITSDASEADVLVVNTCGFIDAAKKESIEAINRDKKTAAQRYLEWANDKKNSIDEVYKAISDPDYAFTLTPEKVFKTAEFMAKIGSVKDKPNTWQELFFPEVHNLPGN